ncbi:ArsR/SmtB family transcription factor [Litoreibacter janthinus]|uniref:Transcriptional regulator, ArsR family n=1 Tax=Litoreibacter janthinus TaxID=670154 RepID=A0A1I6HEP9_9RHOB|nr:helix-turn-helix transcriptional regulator [Litoreibacter janthinus]SFR52962.1 transcriptional regulator, ArsR family [Litoreibacter janthinus]
MITNDDMDSVFHALAHTTRRAILDHVRAEPGLPVGKLARKFDVSRIAVMNHLAVLEKAGLIISGKDGRTRRLYMNVMPIQGIYDRWTDTFSAHWADRLSTIKYAAEAVARKSERGNEDD